MITRTTGKIESFKELSPSVRHFKLKLKDPLPYHSGQFINLIYSTKTEKIKRAYSIASAPSNKSNSEIELCIKHVENGKFSPILFQDNLLELEFNVMGALGLFKIRNPNKNQVFLGAGTGVAPLRSFILELLYNQNCTSPISLFLGIRYENEILYEQEFLELEKKFSNFKFHPIVSRPTKFWKGKNGYVQHHIENIENLKETEFYICGLKSLVDECENKLTEFKVPKEQIKSEKY